MIMLKKIQTLKQQAGVSLIEVLITIIIMAIGLLGIAGLQNTSLKFSYESYLRTQGSFLAYDLIDRIRANPDGGPYNLAFNETPPQVDCFDGDTCSETDIRQFDLYYWKQQVDELLPEAMVDVRFDPVQSMYTLRIEWDDRVEKDVEDIATETKEFIYTFQVNN